MPITLASMVLLGGCEKNGPGPKDPLKRETKGKGTFQTINLFGFEESELHHIHNTVELHRNIFLVRYDAEKPDELEWVNCPISATYQYAKSGGRRVESMHITSQGDLRARVPVNYARFSAYVSGGKALEFNYVTIGSYELIGDFRIPENDPDCARATHYVTTLSVGAFNFGEESKIEGGVDVEVPGKAGVGASASRGKGTSTSMGDLSSCMDDGTAAMDCFTPLQLMMMPLASRHWSSESVAQDTDTTQAETAAAQDDGDATTAGGDLSLRIDENAWRPGSFMAATLERLLVVASRVNMTTNYGFDDKASTLVAGFLGPGRSQQISRPLEAGKNYAIFAANSSDVNIDMAIYDSSGNVVAIDQELDGNPAVTFTPAVTDNYRIELAVVDEAEAFGALVVMSEGGLRIDAPILQSVFQRLLDSGAYASAKIQEMGFANGLVFHENDWAVQGVILYPGEAIKQTGIDLDPSSAVFSAVSHEESFNIDLEVTNTATGEVVSDTAPDGKPLVVIEAPSPDTTYDLRVIYGEGTDGTMATSLILKIAQ